MDWEELSVHVAKFERTVAPIPGDGYCMIEAMRYCLQEDFGEKIAKEKFRENIKDELYEGIAGYAQGHVGGIRKFFKDVEAHFANAIENYTTDVVDIILGSVANTIKSHVGIFQNIGGKAVVIFQHCNETPKGRTIYLKFDYYPENPGRNHYSSIVLDKTQSHIIVTRNPHGQRLLQRKHHAHMLTVRSRWKCHCCTSMGKIMKVYNGIWKMKH